MPPETVAVADPLFTPWHAALILESTTLNATGSETRVDPLLSMHPLASVTLSVYVPCVKEIILAVVAPVDHK